MMRNLYIFQGYALLAVGVVMCVFMFLVAASRDAGQSEAFIVGWIFGSLIGIVFIESGWRFIKLGKESSEANMNVSPPQTVFSAPAQVFGLIGRINYGASIFIILMAGVGFFLFTMLLDLKFSDTGAMYSVAGTFAGYLILRTPLRAVSRRLGVLWRKRMPSYVLAPDAITIDFNIIGIGSKAPPAVTIPFNELETVKVLNWAEATAYEKFQIKADPVLWTRSVKSMYDFLKGTVPKPTVYTQVQGNGPIILLKGPDLVYLITVANQDTSDLIKAFSARPAYHEIN
jgi:hypothetical protein